MAKDSQGYLSRLNFGPFGMRLLNRNFVGTHFGGAMFAMADPFFMIMMMQNLGRE